MGDTLIDVPVSDTASVWKAIQDVKESGTDVDLFIHAMAISDYTVDKIVDLDELIHQVSAMVSNGDQNQAAVANRMRNPPTVTAGGKVSSTMQHPVLYLKPTEKILPKIKTLWPNTTLVGFKLLNGVPLSELLSVAETAMEKVDGDYVLANDLTQINGDDHVAHLLARGEPAVWRKTAYTKTGIVDLFEELANR
jgi:phosphopantothenate-cysteine ligase